MIAPNSPTLSIIVVSYNTRLITLDCLRTLYRVLGNHEADIWVIDNASTDGSPNAIRKSFPHVHLIVSKKNRGFGAANNLGMKHARGRFFLLINSDAFPEPGAITAMLNYLWAHPHAAVVGPRLLNRNGSLQQSCFRFPTPTRAWLDNLWISAAFDHHSRLGDYRRWKHDTEQNVEFVSGACFMVRREAYLQVGGFDEKFFMYSEQSDWMWRMRQAGWQIAFTPTAEVTHLGGSSGAIKRGAINPHFFNSLDYYQWKHHGLPGLISLRMAMVIGCFLRTILWGIVLLTSTRQRDFARNRTKLLSWLFFRQAMCWRLRFS